MNDRTPASPRGKCPVCGKPAATDFRPFCSARCADVDLNRWLSGAYVIPAGPEEPTDSGELDTDSGEDDDA